MQAEERSASFKRSNESLHRELAEARAAVYEEGNARQVQTQQHSSEIQGLCKEINEMKQRVEHLQQQQSSSTDEAKAEKEALHAKILELQSSLALESAASEELVSEHDQTKLQLQDAEKQIAGCTSKH
jgi:chromosome segregation ATPase